MKLLHWILKVLLVGVIASCRPSATSPEEQKRSPAQDSIQTFVTAYYDAMSRRNWPEYRDFFWEKATLTTVWQPSGLAEPAVVVVAIDEFIRQTPEGPDSKPVFEEKMTAAPEIRIEGNLATVWARYDAKFGTEDDLMQWSGTDVFTLMKHQGEWKIVSLAYE